MYEGFKHLHALFAVLSFVSLLARIVLAWKDSSKLNSKPLKIVPHAVDGLFVLSIVGILVVTGAHPFTSGFHTEKFIGFLIYVVFSVLAVLALKGRFPAVTKVPFSLIAILTWLWLAHVAFAKQPILFATVL
ncbi:MULTISPECIES: SirB2 family protein [Gammaproteobacteria]|uniref:SirB2 family protein n=1 Tax=Gammaproteobacteria TaxID=1236 RepID=UPI000DCF7FB8|nr:MULTISPECIES: SirB2 family protein [Gammaproteobacteria]RTE87421.1 invasion protein [Aliidiomarina sp. B3213]TCZ92794.1 invasion protein [Lysobacter sp. N42]